MYNTLHSARLRKSPRQARMAAAAHGWAAVDAASCRFLYAYPRQPSRPRRRGKMPRLPGTATRTFRNQEHAMAGDYRFSFGPWNIHEGADPLARRSPDGGLCKETGAVQAVGFRRRAVPRRRRRAGPGGPFRGRGGRRKRRPSRRCSTARGWWPSSSPRGSGSTPTASTAASPPTTRTAAAGPSTARSGRSTSPTPWARG